MKITLDLPKKLAAEAEAKRRGCTLSDLAVEGLRILLAERKNRTGENTRKP